MTKQEVTSKNLKDLINAIDDEMSELAFRLENLKFNDFDENIAIQIRQNHLLTLRDASIRVLCSEIS